MEDKDMMNVWQSYDQQLKAALVLNRKNTEDITRMKVQSFLASMKPIKIFTLLVGFAWVAFVDMIIFYTFHVASPFFLVSAIIQVLISKLAIIVYCYHLVLIYQTDISEPVVTTQERLARIQSSTIWVTRLSFLQLPVWTTFYWTTGMLVQGNRAAVISQFVITGLFVFAAIWLFINIRLENSHKKWFRLIFRGSDWDPLIRSKALLEEIGEYKNTPAE